MDHPLIFSMLGSLVHWQRQSQQFCTFLPQVDRTGEVSTSGNGANGAQLRQNRNSTSKLQQQQSRKKGGKAQQPPQQTRKQTETSSEQQSTPSVVSEAIKSAKTMQELSEVCSLRLLWLR